MTLALLAIFPFALVRGRAFNARHTIHRSVRFRYLRFYTPSYVLFIGYFLSGWVLLKFAGAHWRFDRHDDYLRTLINIPLLYWLILAPAYHCIRHRIMINQLRFGKLGLRYSANFMPYYCHFLASLIYGSLFLTFLVAIGVFAMMTIHFPLRGEDAVFWLTFFFRFPDWFFFNFALLIAFVTIGVYRSRIIPLFYSSIRFEDGNHMECTVSARKYFFNFYLVNSVAFVLSLGLLYPWIKVRTWRYITKSLTLHLSEETAAVLSSEEERLSPLAEEFADVQDLELDFGVI